MSIQLPKPTGTHTVGTTDLHIVDPTRKEWHDERTEDPRELMATVWYPAASNPNTPRAAYPAQELTLSIAAMEGKDEKELEYLSSIQTNAYQDAPASTKGPFPVILLSPGFGASRGMYTTLAEDLASHGYVVVATNHPYCSRMTIYPDGRQVKQSTVYEAAGTELEKWQPHLDKDADGWTKDLSCILDYVTKQNETSGNILTGLLDLDKVGVVGHSFGGIMAMNIAEDDPRFKAVVNFDWAMFNRFGKKRYTTLTKPMMILHALTEGNEMPWYLATDEEIIKLCDMTVNDSYRVRFKNADHDTFSDYNLLRADALNKAVLDPLKATGAIRKVVLDFFGKYLCGTSAPVLDGSVDLGSNITVHPKPCAASCNPEPRDASQNTTCG